MDTLKDHSKALERIAKELVHIGLNTTGEESMKILSAAASCKLVSVIFDKEVEKTFNAISQEINAL